MELWDLFDSDRNPLHRTHERGMALPAGAYHQVVEVWTFNTKGEILLTLRHPEKEAYPDYWGNTGGSVQAGESSLEAAVRELYEETGIQAEAAEFDLMDTVQSKTAFYDIYFLNKDWPIEAIRFQEGETVGAKWVTFQTMAHMMANEIIAPPITHRFDSYKTAFEVRKNAILHEQLVKIIKNNETVYTILNRLKSMELPAYYVGAGCITQSVWNHITHQPLMQNIKDVDIVYYDDSDLSEAAELAMSEKIQTVLKDLAVDIDVKNEARVHLWYADKFGYEIAPYTSVEKAIDSWPTTATAMGVRLSKGDSMEVYAPYGLDDVFAMIVRANKIQITEPIYLAKANKWSSKWSSLEIIPW